jgi:hypothetical protein
MISLRDSAARARAVETFRSVTGVVTRGDGGLSQPPGLLAPQTFVSVLLRGSQYDYRNLFHLDKAGIDV